MSDDTNNNEDPKQQEQQPQAQDAPENNGQDDQSQDAQQKRTEISELPEDVQSYIKELREEAKAYRKEKERIANEKREAEEQRLAEDEKWKELADKRANELAEMRTYKQRWEELEERVSESNKARIEALKDDQRKLVPSYDDPLKVKDWLDAFEAQQKRVTPPPTDAGARSDQPGQTVKLTQEQREMATMMGLTPEQYAKQLASIQRQRNEGVIEPIQQPGRLQQPNQDNQQNQ